MSDETALLAAIWNEPHEDTPRLVYADWLEETGEPANVGRAEFIRVQCELARLDDDDPPRPGEANLASWGMSPVECPSPSPRRADLVKREAALRKVHAAKWKAAVPAKLRSAPYHRGFLAPKLQVASARKFLSLKEADLAPAPLWDFAIKYHRTDFPKALASSTFLRVGQLELRADSVPPAGYMHALAGSPHARNICRLRPSYPSGTDGLFALAESPHLVNLTALQLAYQNIEPGEFARAFGKRKRPRPLRELYLRANKLDDSSVTALARSPWCLELRALSLDENGAITDEGIQELIRSPVMKNLRYLSLSGLPRLTDRGVVALAESPNSANLRVLFLNYSGPGDRGAAAIAESKHLARLEFVALFDTKLNRTSPAAKALQKRFGENARF